MTPADPNRDENGEMLVLTAALVGEIQRIRSSADQ